MEAGDAEEVIGVAGDAEEVLGVETGDAEEVLGVEEGVAEEMVAIPFEGVVWEAAEGRAACEVSTAAAEAAAIDL